MGRANLGTLLNVATEKDTTHPVEPAPAPREPAPASTPADKPTPTRTRNAPKKPAASPTASGPTHWTEFERLEARLRDDQVEQLDALIRRLNKKRAGTGERITKNTLLRVAVDLLLERRDDLDGGTEAEILAALH